MSSYFRSSGSESKLFLAIVKSLTVMYETKDQLHLLIAEYFSKGSSTILPTKPTE
jgi:hypothetical protein